MITNHPGKVFKYQMVGDWAFAHILTAGEGKEIWRIRSSVTTKTLDYHSYHDFCNLIQDSPAGLRNALGHISEWR